METRRLLARGGEPTGDGEDGEESMSVVRQELLPSFSDGGAKIG